MESILALTIGTVALLLSILATVLATVANRRHMAHGRVHRRMAAESAATTPASSVGPGVVDPPEDSFDGRADILGALESRLEALDAMVGEVSGAVARLDGSVSAGESRWNAAVDQAEAALERTELVELRMQFSEELSTGHAEMVGAQVSSLIEQVTALRDHVMSADPTALRHVAIVRYDAFADVGGRLSYSLAVLDDTDTGFVVTTLAGKSEVRTYVRAVSRGDGDGTLTAEEQQAIEAARQGAGSRP